MPGNVKKGIESEGATDAFALKDALVLIPLFATALALAWEVGFFFRIKGGAFGLFSTSEHIASALEALPLALTISIGAAAFMTRPRPENKSGLHGWRAGTATGIFLAGLLVSGTLYITNQGQFAFVWVMCLTGAVWFGIESIPGSPTDRWPKLVLTAAGLVCLALAMGFDVAQRAIVTTRPLNTMKTDEGELRVRFLRSGERGVLYFDPVRRTFGLARWESIKKVDWEISSIHPWR